MKVKYELLIAFLSHLQCPSNLIVRPALHSKDSVFIADNQSSSVQEECIYKVSKDTIYSISSGWHASLELLIHEPDSFPEFRKEFGYLLDRHPFEILKPKKAVLPPFSDYQNWADQLSDNSDIAYKQLQGLLPLGADVKDEEPDPVG